MSNVVIRPAEHTDLEQILAMGQAMHKASNFADMEYSAQQFGEFVVELIAAPGNEVFVAEVEGELGGMVLVSLFPSFFGPDLMAAEHLLYVRPGARKHGVGLHLLYAYTDWAERNGAKRIQAGNSAGMPDESYVKLLSRVGLHRAGSLMYRNL